VPGAGACPCTLALLRYTTRRTSAAPAAVTSGPALPTVGTMPAPNQPIAIINGLPINNKAFNDILMQVAVRFVNLGAFHDYVFDEHYYVHDAVALLHHGLAGPGWHTADQATQSHPLLGDETIALGVAVLGDNPWGWRATSALAGVELIALVYPLARRLLLRRPWAVAAAGLAACDTLLIVQSRVAMLDGFVALWTLLCVYCALRAARARQGKLWLILCGVVGGLAVSSKWSGALALVAALAVLILWRRRARHVPIAWLVLALVAVPGAIYVLTYVPYFAAGHSLGQWLDLQRFMATKGWTIHHPDSISSSPSVVMVARSLLLRRISTAMGRAGANPRSPASADAAASRVSRP